MTNHKKVDECKINGVKVVLHHMTDVLASEVRNSAPDLPVKEYNVSVRTEKGQTTFKFWGSIREFELHEYSEAQGALYCVISDALSYYEFSDIDEFALELGYEKPSEVIGAFEGCKETASKLEKLGLEEEELRNLWEILTEEYNL